MKHNCHKSATSTLYYLDTTVPLSNLLRQKFKQIYESFALEKQNQVRDWTALNKLYVFWFVYTALHAGQGF